MNSSIRLLKQKNDLIDVCLSLEMCSGKKSMSKHIDEEEEEDKEPRND